MNSEIVLSQIIDTLAQKNASHAPNDPTYQTMDIMAKKAVMDLFGENRLQKANLGHFGLIEFPYVSMGAINSTHLFGLDELIIFAFYWSNKERYTKTADLGANIGLHSLMMARAGFAVSTYEPDPHHFELLKANIDRNQENSHCNLINKAVSVTEDNLEFIRVLGNTTGSHLAGAKPNPYGKLETFTVETAAFLPILRSVDFLKIDVEGHEAVLLTSTKKVDWQSAEAIVEIGSVENAVQVFEHFARENIKLFSQKTGWNKVETLNDMPTSYKEGSLFITSNDRMVWQ